MGDLRRDIGTSSNVQVSSITDLPTFVKVTYRDFTVEEIVGRVQSEGWEQPIRPGVYVYIVQHRAANRAPNPGRYRMRFETTGGSRRLLRQSDKFRPARNGTQTTPMPGEIPSTYHGLWAWYGDWPASAAPPAEELDPLPAPRGTGKLGPDDRAGEYVRRLREGWE